MENKCKLNKFCLLSIILGVLLIGTMVGGLIMINKYKDESKQFKEAYNNSVADAKSLQEALIARNQDVYLLRMEKEEWKELFYSAIDFHPYEGPDW